MVLTAETIKEISKIKKEPKWMLDFRLKSLEKFLELNNPNFGPELKIDFNDINYYKRILPFSILIILSHCFAIPISWVTNRTVNPCS